MPCTYICIYESIWIYLPYYYVTNTTSMLILCSKYCKTAQKMSSFFLASPPYHTDESSKPRAAETKSACKQKLAC